MKVLPLSNEWQKICSALLAMKFHTSVIVGKGGLGLILEIPKMVLAPAMPDIDRPFLFARAPFDTLEARCRGSIPDFRHVPVIQQRIAQSKIFAAAIEAVAVVVIDHDSFWSVCDHPVKIKY